LINIGIEFEFYLKNKFDLKNIVDIIKRYLRKITKECNIIENIEDKKIYKSPICRNTNTFYIEKDNSLNSKYGLELITKIIKENELWLYLSNIFKMIKEIGYTTELTGLHFHLSNENRKKLDKNKFIKELKKIELNTLKKERNGINSIFDTFKNDKVINISNKMEKNFNIVFVKNEKYKNHIEIRAFGGERYEHKGNEIYKKIKKIINVYKKEEIYNDK